MKTTVLFIAVVFFTSYLSVTKGGQCITTGGAQSGVPCVFPFEARGVNYTGCTKDGGYDTAWCSTKVYSNGTIILGNWGECPDGDQDCYPTSVETPAAPAKTTEDKKGCVINLDKVTAKYFPLLIQNNNFVYSTSKNEDKDNILKFDEGEELDLYCHGSSKYQQTIYVKIDSYKSHNHEKKQKVPLFCKDNQFYLSEIEGAVTRSHKPVIPEKVTCSKKQEPVLKTYREKCSPIGADGRKEDLQSLVKVSIGWQLEWNWVEQIGVCHDEKFYETIWTNHTVHGANIKYQDKHAGRPGFRADNVGFTRKNQRFFNWTVSTKLNKMYSKKDQVKMIKNILGTKNKIYGTETIIDSNKKGTNYFAKGHLAPDAAFITSIEQDATYYFMNVAPQFQSFNNGNWVALEMALRDYAEKLGRDLRVFTGTHGILQYPNYNNELKDIFLYPTETSYYIPVPQYYWKVLYDPELKTSVAFIGLNDPHAKQTPKLFCKNMCSTMSWVDWTGNKAEADELDEGYMYCCTLKEAREHIPSMPDLTTGGLLGEDLENTGDTCKAGSCYCTCTGNTKETCSCTCQGDQ